MTRKGKIARLPRPIRDELNHRLDNGEPGLRLVEWLNNLVEVKEILARNFQGACITPQNLSEWKRGGYRDWVAQQERAATLKDFLADAKELGEAASPEKLAESIFNFALVHYAAAMYESMYRPENRDSLNHWSQMLNDAVRLRNCDLARERFELDTQKLAFNTEKVEIQTQLAHQRLELDRARFELSRQKASATTVGQASRLSPSSSPILATDKRIEATHPQSPSAVSPNTEHATRNTELPPPSAPRVDPAKTPLQINVLQPNPAKSSHPFFIFPQTLTVGQASCLSPSSSASPHDERASATPNFPSASPLESRNTHHATFIASHATNHATLNLEPWTLNYYPPPFEPFSVQKWGS